MARERLSKLQRGIIKYLQKKHELISNIKGDFSDEENDEIGDELAKLKRLSKFVAREIYGISEKNKPIPKKILVSISRSIWNLEKKGLLKISNPNDPIDSYASYSCFKLTLTSKALF